MIALLIAILAAIEIARRVPVFASFRAIATLSAKSTAVLRRRGVSEWCKERAVQILSRRLMAASLRSGMYLVLIAAPILLAFALDYVLPLGVRATFLDWPRRLLLLALCVGIAIIRWQFRRRLRPV